MLIIPTISQQNNSEIFEESVYSADETILYSGGYGRIVAPKSVIHNGATYMTATDGELNRNPILIRFQNGKIDTILVGTIDNYDVLFHQNATVLVVEGFIYVFCVNGHGHDLKIWKSNTLDMMDGFTLYHTISGGYGYLCSTKIDKGRVLILTRITTGFLGSPLGFSQILLISDKNDLTNWTSVVPILGDYDINDIRLYPSYIQNYGDNEWNYIGISLRNDDISVTGIQTYYAHAIYKTKDFDTFYNLDETFLKNIAGDGMITMAEVASELIVVGSDPNDFYGTMWAIAINDEIYSSYFDPVAVLYKFYKIDVNGVKTDYPCDIPDLPTTSGGGFRINLFYNGNNIVAIANKKIYSLNLDFGNLQLLKTLNPLLDVALLPEPFTDAIGEEYMIAGSSIYQGYFPYITTNEIFNQ